MLRRNKIEREKKIVSLMIRMYCRGVHERGVGEICGECDDLVRYAYGRLDGCRYGDEKGSCKRCATHCYKSDMREKIKVVMRYAGWRIIFYRPFSVFQHWIR